MMKFHLVPSGGREMDFSTSDDPPKTEGEA